MIARLSGIDMGLMSPSGANEALVLDRYIEP